MEGLTLIPINRSIGERTDERGGASSYVWHNTHTFSNDRRVMRLSEFLVINLIMLCRQKDLYTSARRGIRSKSLYDDR